MKDYMSRVFAGRLEKASDIFVIGHRDYLETWRLAVIPTFRPLLQTGVSQ